MTAVVRRAGRHAQGNRTRRVGALLVAASCAATLTLGASAAAAQSQSGLAERPSAAAAERPSQLADVGFAQKLESQLPLDARFRDESGRDVALGDFFREKPVLLAFVYYQCPMLCSQTMNGISTALKVLKFQPGQDFEVVLVSFDPRDTPEAARQKEQEHLAHWKSQDTAAGWHLLTGDEASIERVTAAAGFSYKWDEESGQFAHVSGILVATPDGRLSRYFYGVDYSARELRMALVESGEGKIGSAIDEFFLYCFHYNPAEGRYSAVAMNIVRLGGAVTLALLLGFILLMRRRDTRAPVERHA